MTRADLAQSLELSDQPLIEAVENGAATLSFELILRLAAVLARHDPVPFIIWKVQRPGIRKTIEVDLKILFQLATLMEKNIEEAEICRPTRVVDEFARSIEKEINYKIEAQHAERFARQFTGNEAIYVPRIFHQTTTSCILTMEYVDGIKASDLDLLEGAGLDRKLIAALIIGSSLIVMMRPGPSLFGLPLLGLVGYACAGVLGIRLLVWIRRSGRL